MIQQSLIETSRPEQGVSDERDLQNLSCWGPELGNTDLNEQDDSFKLTIYD